MGPFLMGKEGAGMTSRMQERIMKQRNRGKRILIMVSALLTILIAVGVVFCFNATGSSPSGSLIEQSKLEASPRSDMQQQQNQRKAQENQRHNQEMQRQANENAQDWNNRQWQENQNYNRNARQDNERQYRIQRLYKFRDPPEWVRFGWAVNF